MESIFGIISALIVLASYPVYGIRIWQRKITTKISSWILFVLISFALSISYNLSGAKENGWVTIGPLIGTVGILVISLFRSKNISFTKLDKLCLFFGTISIGALFFTKQFSNLPVYSLCLAIIADLLGLIPTIVFLKKEPKEDRPVMWIIFSLGYLFSIFAITEHTFANWILPVFMVIAPAFVWIPLVNYRIKNNILLKEWI